MTKTTKISRLAGSNIDARDQVIDKIKSENIQVFHTQASLYRLIEDIKFPYLNRRSYHTSHNRNDYSPNNYFPIVRWMLDRGLIQKFEQTNKYVYVVTEAINQPIDYSPIYTY